MNKGFAKMTEREKIIKAIDEWANAGIGDTNLIDKKLILNALRTLYLMALELKSVVNSLEKAIELENLKK